MTGVGVGRAREREDVHLERQPLGDHRLAAADETPSAGFGGRALAWGNY